MRIAIFCLVLAAACSSEKKKGGEEAPAAGGQGGAAPSTDGKTGVTGSLELTGPFAGTFAWKPDLALTCGCSAKNSDGTADFTMSDAAGKTFISATVKYDGAITVRTGSMPGGMKGTGVKSTCTGEYINSSWHMEIDAALKGDKGESGQVKGTLDLGC